jgi:MFS family permease
VDHCQYRGAGQFRGGNGRQHCQRSNATNARRIWGPLDAITWVAVAYSIAEIILVTMAAWCSTLLGRKRYYILSFSMFMAASVLCGLARSLEMMIAARVLQGMGGGGLIPVAQAIMLETFPEEERGMAIYSMGVVVAPTGPGWLADRYVWLALDFLCERTSGPPGNCSGLDFSARPALYATSGNAY